MDLQITVDLTRPDLMQDSTASPSSWNVHAPTLRASLDRVVDEISGGATSGTVQDDSGNTVGTWHIA